MEERKLLKTMDTAERIGRRLLKVSNVFLVGALMAFGVAAIARLRCMVIECADFDDLDETF